METAAEAPQQRDFLGGTGKQVVFFLVSNIPLAIVTVPHDLIFLGVGAVVMAGLLWSTVQKVEGSKLFDEAAERANEAKLVTTTSFNRGTRMTLCVIYLFACARLAGLSATKELLWQVLDGLRVFVGCMVAFVWGISGYFGQWGRGTGPKAEWNPDGLGWRKMPEGMILAFQNQSKQTRKYIAVLGLTATVALEVIFVVVPAFQQAAKTVVTSHWAF